MDEAKNSTGKPTPYKDFYQQFKIAEQVFVLTVGVLSFLANSLVGFAMLKTKKIRENPSNSFMFAILAINFIFGSWFAYLTLKVSSQLSKFDFFDSLKLFKIKSSANPFHVSSIFAVFLMLINLQVGLSYDRFWAVCYPISYFVRKNSSKKIVITSCIVLGLVCGLYYVFHECVHVIRSDVSFLQCDPTLQFNLDYKGFFSVWATIASALIITFNGTILFTTLRRVSSIIFMIKVFRR